MTGSTNLLASPEIMIGLEMPAVTQWKGFSINRPPDYWFLYRCEQSKSKAILHRWFVQLEHAMSFKVSVERLPANSSTDLAEAIRQLNVPNPKKATVLSYRQAPSTRNGEPAIRFESESQDLIQSKKFNEVIITRERGLAVLDPTLPKAAIIITCSETGPQDELLEVAFSQADAMIDLVDVGPL